MVETGVAVHHSELEHLRFIFGGTVVKLLFRV